MNISLSKLFDKAENIEINLGGGMSGSGYMPSMLLPCVDIMTLVRIAYAAKELVDGLRNSECMKVSEYCSKCADALEGVEP